MAQQRLPVRKIREVLRLKAAGLSDRRSRRRSVRRARRCGSACAEPARPGWCGSSEDLTETVLHARLYERSVPLSSRPQPDFAQLHAELSRAGVQAPLPIWASVPAPRASMTSASLCLSRRRRRLRQ